MGFPIRKFTDQSLFAAPHDLSQRTTSFIASQRQGIHQIPLRHLIALIAKARVSEVGIQRTEIRMREHSDFRFQTSDFHRLKRFEKTSFASNASGDLSGQAPNPRLVARETKMMTRRLCSLRIFTDPGLRLAPSGLRPNALPLHNVRDRGPRGTAEDRILVAGPFGLRHAKRFALDETDKVHRKDSQERQALTTRTIGPPSSVLCHPNGGARRDRTDDLMLAKHALSQLSYGPVARSATEVRNQNSEYSDFRLQFSEFCPPSADWWAWEDLNLRPHAYQARALTN
jgi:hypothetical protein